MNKIIKDKLRRGLALTVNESWNLYKYIEALEQQQYIHDTCMKCVEFSEFKEQPNSLEQIK